MHTAAKLDGTFPHCQELFPYYRNQYRMVNFAGRGWIRCTSSWYTDNRRFSPYVRQTFFRGVLVMKKFLRPFSPFRWFKNGNCQLLPVAKECALLSTGKLPRRFAQELCGQVNDRARNDLKNVEGLSNTNSTNQQFQQVKFAEVCMQKNLFVLNYHVALILKLKLLKYFSGEWIIILWFKFHGNFVVNCEIWESAALHFPALIFNLSQNLGIVFQNFVSCVGKNVILYDIDFIISQKISQHLLASLIVVEMILHD